MNIIELLSKVENLTSKKLVKFTIEKNIFNKADGRKQFNKIIRANVSDKFGVYVWGNSKTNEIYYIGMAGKIKTDGSLSNHSLKKRLLASRGRDKDTKKDIQTNDFIKSFMIKNGINSLDFYLAYSKDGIPPTYIEGILLFEYYYEKKRLPKLNNSF